MKGTTTAKKSTARASVGENSGNKQLDILKK